MIAAPFIFRRWFYGALYDRTMLNPSNIFYMIAYARGNGLFSVPVLDIPSSRMVNRRVKHEFSCRFIEYSLHNHPLTNDILIFVDSCKPDIAVTDMNTAVPAHKFNIMHLLSRYDDDYPDFLLMLSMYAGLVKPVISIHAHKVAPDPEGLEKYLALSGTERLKFLFDAALKMIVYTFNSYVYDEENLINDEYIRNLLSHPIPVDDAIFDIFGAYFDADEFMNELRDFSEHAKHSGYSGEENEVLEFVQSILGRMAADVTETHRFSVLFDKFFLHVFGDYMQIISPLYFKNQSVRDSVKLMSNAISIEGVDDLYLYNAADFYTLTPLGLALLDVPPNQRNTVSVGAFDLKRLLTTDANIDDAALAEWALAYEIKGFDPHENLHFRITRQNEREPIAEIIVSSDISLDMLYYEICLFSRIKENDDFVFYVRSDANLLIAYGSDRNPHWERKASDICLNDLNLAVNDSIKLIANGTRYNIKLYEISEAN